MKKENQENENDIDFDMWENIDWDAIELNSSESPNTSNSPQEKVEVFTIPPEVLNRRPGHVFTMEDEIKVLKYLGWYDELPDDERIRLEKMLQIEEFASSANAEDLSHNLLAKLLKDGVQKALAEHQDAKNDDSVIDFYIIQTIRQYKANLPESHAFRIKTDEKNKGF